MAKIFAVASFLAVVEISSAAGVSNVPVGPCCLWCPWFSWLPCCCCLLAVVGFPAVAGVPPAAGDPVVAVTRSCLSFKNLTF